ncbi:MAG TPA: phosphomannomutase/phosphoglucomutase [Rhodanobacteraceae bacterium]|nr:phosphomannomutase/phosphoglucomutase [Rhodanobacteraceae bacterium]
MAALRGRRRDPDAAPAADGAGGGSPRRVAWRLWLRSVQRTLLVALLVAGVLFFVLQANLLSQQQQASAALHDSVQRAAQALAKPLAAARTAVTTATADPQVMAALAQEPDANLDEAQKRLQALLPEAQSVAVHGPHLQVLLHANLAKLGYIRAAQLARAQSGGDIQVGVVGHEDQQHSISIVQPLVRDGSIAGYAAVDLPFAPLVKVFAGLPMARGRVALRLGNRDDAAVLLERGEAARGDGEADEMIHIPDTGLWLSDAAPPSAAMLPDRFPPALAWALAIACLLGALAVAAGRRRLLALGRALQGRGRHGAAEPTLAQVLNQPPATPAGAGATAVPGDAAAASDEPAAAASATVSAGPPVPVPGVPLERDIFRAYDIRGVCGSTLDPGIAHLIGRAVGSVMHEQGLSEIVVGRDGRLSGPELAEALGEGLRASGIDVIDIGAVPTPVVYFACFQLNTGCGVAVTGSHNPPDYNGFKVVVGGVTLAGEAIQDLYARISEGRFSEGRGALRHVEIADDYIQRIASDVQIERSLKVVVDCGNGIAGAIAPQLLEAIGTDVVPLYDEVDGSFPNHHPDPSDPRNLDDLILAVKHQEADLGIAFDGDGDRLGVVTREGEIIYPDRLLMLFAIDVLARDPGATIIYDVKCTGHLQSVILRQGGSPLMWKTGHSLVKAKMRETGAALAGEMSGHFFFAERWYGFDDGMYAAARLLEIIAGDAQGRAPEAIFATLPKGVSTPELHIAIDDGPGFVERLRERAQFDEARLTTIDGVRADWPDGWGLVRASNTTPVLVLRFDADDEAALERIEAVFRAQLLALKPDLKLPF